jgi:hypothetical protein
MTYRDNSKLSDELGQAIRRPPTGLYELSPSLQRPHTELRQRQPPRIGGVLRAIDTTGSGWKVVTHLLVVSVMVLMGIGLMILSLEMIGTSSKPPIETRTAAPVPTPDEVNGPGIDLASIERLDLRKVADSAATAKVVEPTSTVRADWLVDNLAKAGQDLRSRKQALSWFAPTTSPDHTDSSPQEVAPSVGEPASDFTNPTNSELRSPPISRTRTEKRRFGAHYTARRGFKSARRKGGHGSYWDGFFQLWQF